MLEMFKTTIFDQLKEEHGVVKDLLEKAQSCAPAERKAILQKIEKELVPHARGEEKTLYALMLKAATEEKEEKSKDLTNEAYEEHRVVDELMAEIKMCDVHDQRWPALMKVISENLEHHIKEEENDLFPKAKKLLSQDELSSVHEAYNHAKEDYKRNLPKQSQIAERTPTAELR